MKFCKIIPLIGLYIPIFAQASWPIFSVLTPEQVKQQIITKDCKKGEGHIPFGAKIRISARNIPVDQIWYWEYTGTSQCQKMSLVEKPVKYLMFEQTGRSAGNTIMTIYGDTINGEPLFSFTFTIPQEPADWNCGPLPGKKPPVRIKCVRDI